MTDILRQPIDHPSAWTAEMLQGPDTITTWLTEDHLSMVDALLARTRHLAPQQVTLGDLGETPLDPLFCSLFQEIMEGRGAVLIRGLSPARYSAEQLERIYWIFGIHWGNPVVQSQFGDRLGRVRLTPVGPENPNDRLYRSDLELTLHTDKNEIVGLMCVAQAEAGGESQIASSIAVHNRILATRPDLLPPLYEGYYYADRESALTDRPVTPYKVPVFAWHAGRLSCQIVVETMRTAAARLGAPLPPLLDEALRYFQAVAADPAMQLEFLLQPGDMMILNNFTVTHARKSFRNSERHERSLLRLWLDLPDGRDTIPEFYLRAAELRSKVAAAMAAAT